LLDFEKDYNYVVQSALRNYKAAEDNKSIWTAEGYSKSASMMATQGRAWKVLEDLLISYSAGNPLEELREFFPTVLEYWEEFAKYDKAFDDSPEAMGRRVPHIELVDTEFIFANQLLCMCLLLGYSALLPRLAPIIDYENDEPDKLIETLLAPFLPGRAPAERYLRHLPYRKLQKVFDATPDKRPALMIKYLDEWCVASRREGYHNQQNAIGFLGYWSWEAAAVTWLFEIDDSSYREKMFYPADLVAFARAQYSPKEAIAQIPRPPIRVEGGEPCPREGYWWSPADKNGARFFIQERRNHAHHHLARANTGKATGCGTMRRRRSERFSARRFHETNHATPQAFYLDE
jgi:hypothetical protein